MERRYVYEAIDSERDHQDAKWVKPKHNHSITEYLVFMDHYIKQAMFKVSTQDGEDNARSDLRKIAALAVAAMEEHGVFFRGYD